MVWGILGALDEEVALIREKMDVREKAELLGTCFYQGTVSGKEVVLACCGVGKVNAAVCTATLIQRFGAGCVINVGIAGAMRHGLHVMDVIAAREVGFHDQDTVMLHYYPEKEFFQTDGDLLDLCTRACAQLPGMKGTFSPGRIVSGDVFVSDKATKDAINARYAPDCVEMEGAAVGHACYMHGAPFLVIRTMSDTADDGAQESYDNFIHDAAAQSAHIILKMLEIG
ncbi:5'-methylthioadenosine/adenosylhomocysteine nucleosidase [Intestinibacillus massiliensis]|nr:5'-methylthioadenosine/adenosylhomocysteine nucleosidase [Intestinibacillus massiliensis]